MGLLPIKKSAGDIFRPVRPVVHLQLLPEKKNETHCEDLLDVARNVEQAPQEVCRAERVNSRIEPFEASMAARIETANVGVSHILRVYKEEVDFDEVCLDCELETIFGLGEIVDFSSHQPSQTSRRD